MSNKIAFINGKGGCGKTTSIFHVSGVLARCGERVLVIDFDKQRNTTDTLLMHTEKPPKTALDFMLGEAAACETVGPAMFQSRANAKPKHCGVDCMAADVWMEDEAVLRRVDGSRVGAELDSFVRERGYGWVLVDMPPSNKALNDICFSYIADYVIVPFSSDLFSVTGYGDILDTIERARGRNASLNVLGVYLARYMANCQVDRYVRNELAKQLGEVFIDAPIPLAADIREAVMFGRPISYYKDVSHSRKAYERLVQEIRRRVHG
jgi:chromosome partitioning protein